MVKLGLDPNEHAKTRILSAAGIFISFYIFMIAASSFLLATVLRVDNLMEHLLSLFVTNTYATLFVASFSLMLHGVYRRFETINECIR